MEQGYNGWRRGVAVAVRIVALAIRDWLPPPRARKLPW